MEYIVKSVEETYALAKKIADNLKGGEIILLNGDLGAGKTTFTKGLAKALGINDVVTSPTFTFMKQYLSGRIPLYHFDMYRVEEEDELYELGLSEYLYLNGVCVIEWNKFENIENPIVINITVNEDLSRKFEIK
jgi:tRNA threonylcarbamoyladenosine biosynthesis protein TsaE